MKTKILQQNTREYTDSEMLVRIWAREDVQTVMAKRAYAQMNNEQKSWTRFGCPAPNIQRPLPTGKPGDSMWGWTTSGNIM